MIIHVVAPGESIYTISKSYGVPPSRIINDNELKEPNKLVVGQTLVIMFPETEHIVKEGDTLTSIAEEYNVSINQLLRNNSSLDGGTEIYVGQVIVIDYNITKKGTFYVNGYAYPFIDLKVLRKTLPYLTYITIFSYTFDENGNIEVIASNVGYDDEEVINISREYGVAPLMALSTLTAEGMFSSELAHRLFMNEDAQENLIFQIIDTLHAKDYYGLNIDFEYIYADDKDRFSEFVRKVTDRLREEGFIVTVAVVAKTRADQPGLLYAGHDYRALGEIVDRVLLMTYEWGYAYGEPMAIAPLNEVQRVLDYSVTEIPPEKTDMGIPNYGYDWTLPFELGTRARAIGNVEAVEQAINLMAAIMYDETSQAPYYNYYRDRIEHVVWFEDARSIEAKLNLATDYTIGGVGYWNLMRYFPQNWLVLNAQYNINKVLL